MSIAFENKDLGRAVELEVDPSFDPELDEIAKHMKAQSVMTGGRLLAIRENSIFIENIEGNYFIGEENYIHGRTQVEIPYDLIKKRLK